MGSDKDIESNSPVLRTLLKDLCSDLRINQSKRCSSIVNTELTGERVVLHETNRVSKAKRAPNKRTVKKL